jgi:methylenetetrahydrofolate dehydrogenase (NADP+)/methenyltetrahydrofolate cyclohydrolase
MQYIDCKKYAQEILDTVKAIPDKKKLVIISVGNNPASESYVKGKIKDCEYCGIPYEVVKLDETMLSPIISSITTRNWKRDTGGIIVQLPLPDRFKEYEDFIVNQVQIDKDVDGFRQDSPFKPCTPEGIMYLLRKELGDLTGKNVLVIGRGKLVGEPIAKMLLDANCTVTVAHSKTKDLHLHLRRASVIISAVGKPNVIDLKSCWSAEMVVDVGVNRDANGKLVGDCYNFDQSFLANLDMKVTPVPGGIGLLTRAMLMAHVAGLDVNTIN